MHFCSILCKVTPDISSSSENISNMARFPDYLSVSYDYVSYDYEFSMFFKQYERLTQEVGTQPLMVCN